MARFCWVAGLLLAASMAFAGPIKLTLEVDKVQRAALVYPGSTADKTPAPVVFAFHGFLGNALLMDLSTHIEKDWPEATVIYPQGLPVHLDALNMTGTGWQCCPGDLGDRDLHFVDALLKEVQRRYQVDTRRVYATGMSDGAIFTYQLFATRPKTFAAYAPVAGWQFFLQPEHATPRPILIIQGSKDILVKQKMAEDARDTIKRINRCGDQTVEWAPGYLSYQPCASGMPVIWHLWDGGHDWPNDATSNIVKFFKTQVLPAK